MISPPSLRHKKVTVAPLAPFKSTRHQAGFTMWSALFVATVFLTVGYAAMRLVPIYAVNGNIKNAMSMAIDQTEARSFNRRTISQAMNRQLYLDGSHQVLDFKNDLKLKRSKSHLILEVSYDQEVPLFFNIYFLVKFDNVVERPINSATR